MKISTSNYVLTVIVCVLLLLLIPREWDYRSVAFFLIGAIEGAASVARLNSREEA